MHIYMYIYIYHVHEITEEILTAVAPHGCEKDLSPQHVVGDGVGFLVPCCRVLVSRYAGVALVFVWGVSRGSLSSSKGLQGLGYLQESLAYRMTDHPGCPFWIISSLFSPR